MKWDKPIAFIILYTNNSQIFSLPTKYCQRVSHNTYNEPSNKICFKVITKEKRFRKFSIFMSNNNGSPKM